MQAITGNKLLHHLDRVNGDFRPITADVFLTNFCNNRCDFCTYGRWERGKAAYMSYEDFVKYATRLRELGVRGIILTGGGEPTLNPDFDSITEWLEAQDIPYGINTNFNILKTFSPDYLKVSLDGWDEESYQNIRGVRGYGLTRNNIIAYARWKNPGTNLGIQMIATKLDKVRKFYHANKDLPVDYIVFRPVESTNGKYYEDVEGWFEKNDIISYIKAVQENDKRVVLNFKWDLLNEHFDSCVAHWAQIALDEKGNVIFCCHKPYEKIGHIMDEDIMEKHSKAKTNMKMCDVPCRLTAPNMFMEMAQERVKNEAFI